MSFWLHDGYCKSFTKKISTRVRFCFTIILIGCLFVGWSTFLLFPRYLDTQREDSAVKHLNNKILVDQQLLKSFSTVNDDYESLSQQVVALINKTPCIQDGLNFIVDQMQKHSLSCKEIAPGSIDPHDCYNNHFFSIKMKGDFKQLVAFLTTLDNADFSYSFEYCNVVRWKKGTVKMDAGVNLKEVFCTL